MIEATVKRPFNPSDICATFDFKNGIHVVVNLREGFNFNLIPVSVYYGNINLSEALLGDCDSFVGLETEELVTFMFNVSHYTTDAVKSLVKQQRKINDRKKYLAKKGL